MKGLGKGRTAYGEEALEQKQRRLESSSRFGSFVAWANGVLERNEIKYRVVSLVVMAGVAIALAIYKYNLSVEDEREAARLYFGSTVQSVSSSLDNELSAAGLYHRMLLNHVLANQRVPTFGECARFTDAEVFWNITQVLRGEGLGLRVTPETRGAFEALGRSVYGAGFRVSERNGTGALGPAANRTEHMSILFIQPLATNRAAVGFDILSEPRRAAAIRTSLRTGAMVPSDRVQLVQSTRPEFSSIVMVPFYRLPGRIPPPPLDPDLGADTGADTLAAYAAALRARGLPLTLPRYLAALNSGNYTARPRPGAEVLGVVSAACVYQVILDNAVRGIDLFMVDVVLYMADAPPGARYLAHCSGPSDSPAHAPYTMDQLQASAPGDLAGDIVVSHALLFGIRPYRLDIIARTGYFTAKTTDVPVTLFVVSLLGSVFGQVTTIVAVWYIFYQRTFLRSTPVVRVHVRPCDADPPPPPDNPSNRPHDSAAGAAAPGMPIVRELV